MNLNRTFNAWIPRYVNSLRTKNYSEHTITGYTNVLELYARYRTYLTNHNGLVPAATTEFAECGIDAEIDTTHIEISDFFALLRNERRLAATSIRKYAAALSSFYRYLIDMDILQAANPMDRFELPKIKDRELKYLQHTEVMNFIESLKKPRDALLVRTIYATGMRNAEIRSMKVDDIDFAGETIRVHGKGGKFRMVFCDADTLTAIKEFLNGRNTGYVFPGRNGKPLTSWAVGHIFKLYAPEGITPHKIRHSYASELYRRSHNIRVVQENLGHASIKTTEIYVHTDLDERKNVYKQYFPLAVR